MHIPDGALSPQTFGATYAVMVPIWVIAGRRVQRTLTARTAPLLAIGAAFSFLVMMFNVPIPFGSTGHAVGAVLIALLLGPWAAVLAVSVVLAVQAFLFGDGGILALGANCLTMAFIMPMVGYGAYWLVARRTTPGSRRSIFAAGLAGYVGLNVAALATAVFFGLQPLIAHAPEGRPLYFPYGLVPSIIAMSGEHLLVFGFVEAAVTAFAYGYVARTEPTLFARGGP